MVPNKNTTKKPQITYPTNWGFKIIGKNKDKLEACIKEVLKDKEYLCSSGNISKGGKFHSYNASCEVSSQEERDRIFKCFQDHPDVNIVI